MTLARLWRLELDAMGTECALTVTAHPFEHDLAEAALAAARAEIAACERVLTRFDPASDLGRLNGAAGEWVAVDPRLLDALAVAVRGHEDSGGRFDATILPLLAALGYDRSFQRLDGAQPQPAPAWTSAGTIDLDRKHSRARLGAGVGVDLGGLGKGFAADRALRAMRRAWPGIPGAIVDLGGDIAVRGTPPELGPWRLAVADPRRPGETLGEVHTRRGGVATSGRDRRRFGPGHRFHHLIDPDLAAPAAGGPLTVTVAAASATEAEVHATALAVTRLDAAPAYIAARRHLAALLVPDEGEPFALGDLPYHALEGASR
jgi:thiamine biosynthesis lipoprotein